MMTKLNLKDALAGIAKEPTLFKLEEAKPVERPVVAKPQKAPSRVNKVNVHFPLSQDERNILKILAIELGQPMEHLVIDAVNEVLERHGRPTIQKYEG
jgi:hypothetical protein